MGMLSFPLESDIARMIYAMVGSISVRSKRCRAKPGPRIDGIRMMSIRRLVALTVLAIAVAGGAGQFLGHLVGTATSMAIFLIIAGLIWWRVDRLLVVRERDRRSLPARPEFYSFDTLNPPMHAEEIGGKSLKQITFVVFDTETTGLKPSAGDEIISIAGVRIRDGRVIEAAPFSRLVKSGMKIPRESIRFHGITDEMVMGEAPIAEVLSDFRDYIGDAVLVAHNAAFDMTFLRSRQDVTGIRFDNLVLDTLLLSVFVDQDSRNHSLDAIAKRMGVSIKGRHTALGDSITTAHIFVRLLDLLEARGVTTLRHAMEGSVKVEDILALDMEF